MKYFDIKTDSTEIILAKYKNVIHYQKYIVDNMLMFKIRLDTTTSIKLDNFFNLPANNDYYPVDANNDIDISIDWGDGDTDTYINEKINTTMSSISTGRTITHNYDLPLGTEVTIYVSSPHIMLMPKSVLTSIKGITYLEFSGAIFKPLIPLNTSDKVQEALVWDTYFKQDVQKIHLPIVGGMFDNLEGCLLEGFFEGFTNLTYIDKDILVYPEYKVGNVRSLARMFKDTNIESPINLPFISTLNDISSMYENANLYEINEEFTGKLGSVNNMSKTFKNNPNLHILGPIFRDVTRIDYMSETFSNCNLRNDSLELAEFNNLTNVLYLDRTFEYNPSLKVDMSTFKDILNHDGNYRPKCLTTERMFYNTNTEINSSPMSLDIDNANTYYIFNAKEMFASEEYINSSRSTLHDFTFIINRPVSVSVSIKANIENMFANRNLLIGTNPLSFGKHGHTNQFSDTYYRTLDSDEIDFNGCFSNGPVSYFDESLMVRGFREWEYTPVSGLSVLPTTSTYTLTANEDTNIYFTMPYRFKDTLRPGIFNKAAYSSLNTDRRNNELDFFKESSRISILISDTSDNTIFDLDYKFSDFFEIYETPIPENEGDVVTPLYPEGSVITKTNDILKEFPLTAGNYNITVNAYDCMPMYLTYKDNTETYIINTANIDYPVHLMSDITDLYSGFAYHETCNAEHITLNIVKNSLNYFNTFNKPITALIGTKRVLEESSMIDYSHSYLKGLFTHLNGSRIKSIITDLHLIDNIDFRYTTVNGYKTLTKRSIELDQIFNGTDPETEIDVNTRYVSIYNNSDYYKALDLVLEHISTINFKKEVEEGETENPDEFFMSYVVRIKDLFNVPERIISKIDGSIINSDLVVDYFDITNSTKIKTFFDNMTNIEVIDGLLQDTYGMNTDNVPDFDNSFHKLKSVSCMFGATSIIPIWSISSLPELTTVNYLYQEFINGVKNEFTNSNLTFVKNSDGEIPYVTQTDKYSNEAGLFLGYNITDTTTISTKYRISELDKYGFGHVYGVLKRNESRINVDWQMLDMFVVNHDEYNVYYQENHAYSTNDWIDRRWDSEKFSFVQYSKDDLNWKESFSGNGYNYINNYVDAKYPLELDIPGSLYVFGYADVFDDGREPMTNETGCRIDMASIVIEDSNEIKELLVPWETETLEYGLYDRINSVLYKPNDTYPLIGAPFYDISNMMQPKYIIENNRIIESVSFDFTLPSDFIVLPENAKTIKVTNAFNNCFIGNETLEVYKDHETIRFETVPVDDELQKLSSPMELWLYNINEETSSDSNTYLIPVGGIVGDGEDLPSEISVDIEYYDVNMIKIDSDSYYTTRLDSYLLKPNHEYVKIVVNQYGNSYVDYAIGVNDSTNLNHDYFVATYNGKIKRPTMFLGGHFMTYYPGLIPRGIICDEDGGPWSEYEMGANRITIVKPLVYADYHENGKYKAPPAILMTQEKMSDSVLNAKGPINWDWVWSPMPSEYHNVLSANALLPGKHNNTYNNVLLLHNHLIPENVMIDDSNLLMRNLDMYSVNVSFIVLGTAYNRILMSSNKLFYLRIRGNKNGDIVVPENICDEGYPDGTGSIKNFVYITDSSTSNSHMSYYHNLIPIHDLPEKLDESMVLFRIYYGSASTDVPDIYINRCEIYFPKKTLRYPVNLNQSTHLIINYHAHRINPHTGEYFFKFEDRAIILEKLIVSTNIFSSKLEPCFIFHYKDKPFIEMPDSPDYPDYEYQIGNHIGRILVCQDYTENPDGTRDLKLINTMNGFYGPIQYRYTNGIANVYNAFERVYAFNKANLYKNEEVIDLTEETYLYPYITNFSNSSWAGRPYGYNLRINETTVNLGFYQDNIPSMNYRGLIKEEDSIWLVPCQITNYEFNEYNHTFSFQLDSGLGSSSIRNYNNITEPIEIDISGVENGHVCRYTYINSVLIPYELCWKNADGTFRGVECAAVNNQLPMAGYIYSDIVKYDNSVIEPPPLEYDPLGMYTNEKNVIMKYMGKWNFIGRVYYEFQDWGAYTTSIFRKHNNSNAVVEYLNVLGFMRGTDEYRRKPVYEHDESNIRISSDAIIPVDAGVTSMDYIFYNTEMEFDDNARNALKYAKTFRYGMSKSKFHIPASDVTMYNDNTISFIKSIELGIESKKLYDYVPYDVKEEEYMQDIVDFARYSTFKVGNIELPYVCYGIRSGSSINIVPFEIFDVYDRANTSSILPHRNFTYLYRNGITLNFSSYISNCNCVFLNVEDMDVSNAKTMSYTLSNSRNIRKLDLSKWILPSEISFSSFITGSGPLEELILPDTSNTVITSMVNAFYNMRTMAEDHPNPMKTLDLSNFGQHLSEDCSFIGAFSWCYVEEIILPDNWNLVNNIKYIMFTRSIYLKKITCDMGKLIPNTNNLYDYTASSNHVYSYGAFEYSYNLENLVWNNVDARYRAKHLFGISRNFNTFTLENWIIDKKTRIERILTTAKHSTPSDIFDVWDCSTWRISTDENNMFSLSITYYYCRGFKKIILPNNVFVSEDVSRPATNEDSLFISNIVYGCTDLEEIDFGMWDLASITENIVSFGGCPKLATIYVEDSYSKYALDYHSDKPDTCNVIARNPGDIELSISGVNEYTMEVGDIISITVSTKLGSLDFPTVTYSDTSVAYNDHLHLTSNDTTIREYLDKTYDLALHAASPGNTTMTISYDGMDIPVTITVNSNNIAVFNGTPEYSSPSPYPSYNQFYYLALDIINISNENIRRIWIIAGNTNEFVPLSLIIDSTKIANFTVNGIPMVYASDRPGYIWNSISLEAYPELKECLINKNNLNIEIIP